MKFALTTKDLKVALDELAGRDRHLRVGLDLVGYPEERRGGVPCYEHLLRIIVGQQLSVKAASTIYGRVEAAMGEVVPENYLKKTDQELRTLGLSRQKVAYGRGLSEAVLEGRLKPEELSSLPDDKVMEVLTSLKGFGRWSAEMFLLFSLGRPDVWPADDLGIQSALHKLKNMRKRPDRKKTDALGRPWRPYRGAAAIFLWHYYNNNPL